jgi:hypothetical protein
VGSSHGRSTVSATCPRRSRAGRSFSQHHEP